MQSVPFFLTAHESKQSLHTHHPAYLFLMKQTLTVVVDFDISTVFVSSSFIPAVYWLLLCAAAFTSNKRLEMLFIIF